MPTFEITARGQINCGNGFTIEKGRFFTININMLGITPYNLFSSSRCAAQLVHQFKQNGIDLPKNSPVYQMGKWDIKMVHPINA